ncbi:aminotransferase class III-fold pyridoxal phosphate-dependent enzyme [Dactylosporangium sp. CA-152071]|uniref:aminotransferase class III-fold pyridoxal phosphate-dependent enzyme n=1 Tax=Dactylosporangium sp. CA-152071 TaxID=3239933 RepID=UPI003D8DFFAE
MVTIGKAIGGGIPAAAYGLSTEIARHIGQRKDLDLIDMGGVGGTLAGNALSIAATRATLEHVLTDEAFTGMERLAERFEAGTKQVIDAHGLPWSVSRLGARVEYRFANPAPRNGTDSAKAADADLEDYLHVYLANRGILLTPFHNMALMSPATTEQQVDQHAVVFGAAIEELQRA